MQMIKWVNQMTTVAEQGIWDDFQGTSGCHIKNIHDMVLKDGSSDDFAAYTRNNDNLTLGTVNLEARFAWLSRKGRFVGRLGWTNT